MVDSEPRTLWHPLWRGEVKRARKLKLFSEIVLAKWEMDITETRMKHDGKLLSDGDQWLSGFY